MIVDLDSHETLIDTEKKHWNDQHGYFTDLCVNCLAICTGIRISFAIFAGPWFGVIITAFTGWTVVSWRAGCVALRIKLQKRKINQQKVLRGMQFICFKNLNLKIVPWKILYTVFWCIVAIQNIWSSWFYPVPCEYFYLSLLTLLSDFRTWSARLLEGSWNYQGIWIVIADFALVKPVITYNIEYLSFLAFTKFSGYLWLRVLCLPEEHLLERRKRRFQGEWSCGMRLKKHRYFH